MVTIPFAASTVAACLTHGEPDASLAVVIFQGVFEDMSLNFVVLFWWPSGTNTWQSPSLPKAPAGQRSGWVIGNVAYLAAIGIAFFSPTASLGVSGLVERTLARRHLAPAAYSPAVGLGA